MIFDRTLGVDCHDLPPINKWEVLDERDPLNDRVTSLSLSIYLLSTLTRSRPIDQPTFDVFLYRMSVGSPLSRFCHQNPVLFFVFLRNLVLVVVESYPRQFPRRGLVSQPSEESCHESFSNDMFSIDHLKRCDIFSSCSSPYDKMSATAAVSLDLADFWSLGV